MSEEEDFICERVTKCKNLTIIPITKLRLIKKKIEFVWQFFMTWITFLIEYILALIAYLKKCLPFKDLVSFMKILNIPVHEF